MTPAALLPPSVHVFVRDWLSANNILLAGRDGHVLIDTGYVAHVDITAALVEGPRGTRGAKLARIVNTHGHSDHVGGNASLVRRHGCPVAVPEAEAPKFAAWDQKALLYDYADQRCERFPVDETIEVGSTHVWGDLEWLALAAPGHDSGALVFWNAHHRVLVTGDALWERGFGFVMPRAIDPTAMTEARATLDMLATLDARIVIPGHGEPFTEFGAALERAYSRLAALESDDERVARHAVKVMFTYSLLDRRRFPEADVAAYVDRIGFYRDLNTAILRMTPKDLAALVVGELLKAGAIRRDGADLVPAAAEAG